MMTRSEAKAVLIAWKEASRRINTACRRKGLLVQKLHMLPELSGSSAVNITVAGKDSLGNPTQEPGLAFLPHGTGTSDPTARLAAQRSELESEINALSAEVDALEVFYWEVLRAVTRLDAAHAKILHLHYCTPNPGYTSPEGKAAYFYRLRCAVEAFRTLEPVPIPDDLKEQSDGV